MAGVTIMADLYQQIRTLNFAEIGIPGPVAFEVDGWPDEALRDLNGTDERFGLRGTAFWPVDVSDPAFDPDTQALTDEVTSLVIDKKAFRFAGTRGVRALTAEEIEARNPVPAQVSAAQATIILNDDGLLDRVEGIVAGMHRSVQLWYAKANFWERNSPYVVGIGLMLDLTDADLDDKFRRAARRL